MPGPSRRPSLYGVPPAHRSCDGEAFDTKVKDLLFRDKRPLSRGPVDHDGDPAATAATTIVFSVFAVIAMTIALGIDVPVMVGRVSSIARLP